MILVWGQNFILVAHIYPKHYFFTRIYPPYPWHFATLSKSYGWMQLRGLDWKESPGGVRYRAVLITVLIISEPVKNVTYISACLPKKKKKNLEKILREDTFWGTCQSVVSLFPQGQWSNPDGRDTRTTKRFENNRIRNCILLLRPMRTGIIFVQIFMAKYFSLNLFALSKICQYLYLKSWLAPAGTI